MPGPIASYTARTPDVRTRYSYEHPWCEIEGWLPSVDITGVLIWFRGGGFTSQPNHKDRWLEPANGVIGFSDTDVTAFLNAGVACFRCEYPNAPISVRANRSHPFVRTPHNWRIAAQALAHLQTHAEDGYITGRSSIKLPTDAKRYIMAGPSAGAVIAGMIALATPGQMGGYDRYLQSWGPMTRRLAARCGGAILQDLPGDYRLYGPGISSAGIQHFGVSERWYITPTNGGTTQGGPSGASQSRWESVPRDPKAAISMSQHVALDRVATRHVGLYIDSSIGINEASYLRSGMTFSCAGTEVTGTTPVTAYVQGLNNHFAQIVAVDDVGASRYISAVMVGDAVASDFVMPEDHAFPGAQDYETFNVRGAADTGSASIGTIRVRLLSSSGADTHKTFLTRSQAVDIIEASNYAPSDLIATPHCVELAAMVRRQRELIAEARGVTLPDRYRMGMPHPARISGDTPAWAHGGVPGVALSADLLEWFSEDLRWGL